MVLANMVITGTGSLVFTDDITADSNRRMNSRNVQKPFI
uniref:Uncharacterized protein n=1 Tax=Anguilla anguilla TaxID=7936 RepID=A0A0E9Y104_ANGAN